MRKMIVSLLLLVLLCGCSQNTVSLSENSSDDFTEQVVSTVAVTDISDFPANKVSYSVADNGISFEMNGEQIQSIDLGYSPKTDYISMADYDFDGYIDAFIPFEDSYREGLYYRYNPDTDQFEDWYTLNKIGYVMEPADQGTLLLIMYSQTGTKTVTYQWTNDDIFPVSLRHYYYTANGAVNDFYEYTSNDSRVLLERQMIDKDSDTVTKTYTKDELVYFSINSNSIDILQNGKVLQTIEGDYFTELDLAARKVRREIPLDPPQYLDKYGFYVPEDFLDTTDFDFDGYFDLFIPTDHLSDEGVYYRFDPETELFDEWNELNEIGRLVYTDETDEHLIIFQYADGKKGYEKCLYHWENGRLVSES